MPSKPKMTLAVDVGGVLKEHKRFPDDDEIRWVPDGEWALKQLVKNFDLFIISHIEPHEENQLRKLLENSFVVQYIPVDKWFFVPERKDKVTIMQREHICTLVDDREDIIKWVKASGRCGIQFRSKDYPDWKTIVDKLIGKKDGTRFLLIDAINGFLKWVFDYE